MAGPAEELVKRIERRVERFKEEHGLAEVEVTIELARRVVAPSQDARGGAGIRVRQLLPALRDEPEEVIVPLGAIREIRLSVPGPEQTVGFAGTEVV